MRVLKAVSSPLRLQILDLLLEERALSYTEIMNSLRLNPSRDAGRFAYHLKFLLKADIIEPEAKTKKYRLTTLGQMITSVTESIEEQVSKKRKLLVRTSRFSMEEFDRNKIAESLVREADVPIDLAQKIARETERRLLDFKIKYLTAPLIREFVNAILIEKGLEEYRHKLTRLGLPGHDIAQLIKSISSTSMGVESIHKAAGDAVIEEYILLNVLPRDVADAHLSGTIHISDLGCWILKFKEVVHDLRFFLRWGLRFGRMDFVGPSYPPPKNFESALLIASNAIKIAATEISGEQSIDFFNIFLAPFIKGLSKDEIKEKLQFFIYNLNQSLSIKGSPVEASIGLEFTIPDFLEKKKSIGPNGKFFGNYADYVEESRLILSLLLEVMSEESEQKPIFNPSLIFKIRPEVLKNKECSSLLLQSHQLVLKNGTPYFVNLIPQKKETLYTATGSRFTTDWTKDWELDTLRTGEIGDVVINLPRISYDAEKKETRFFELLDERLELAIRALEIKYRTIKQYTREGLLPFLTQEVEGNQYLRIKNASRLVSFVGLNETIKSLSGEYAYENDKALNLAEEIMRHLTRNVKRYTKKPETRVSLALLPNAIASKRLAELDLEQYGWAEINVQGTKEHPFYSDMNMIPLETNISFKERLSIEEKIHKLTSGGHLAIIQLDDSDYDNNQLFSTTNNILKTYKIGFFAYNRNLAHCNSCQKTFYGILSKCQLCGSANTLVNFSRMSAKYLPLSHWTPAKRLVLSKRAPLIPLSE